MLGRNREGCECLTCPRMTERGVGLLFRWGPAGARFRMYRGGSYAWSWRGSNFCINTVGMYIATGFGDVVKFISQFLITVEQERGTRIL